MIPFMSLSLQNRKTPAKKVIPIMNVSTQLRESGFDSKDRVEGIVNFGKKLEDSLGHMILYSDGSLKRGYNPDLISEKGKFNISQNDYGRFYFGDNFFNSIPFGFKDGKVEIGLKMKDQSWFEIYKTPIFTLSGLYKHHKIPEIIGLFKKEDNSQRKIKFLENFLGIKDKSGFQAKDMLVKNNELRLKLLENKYKNEAELYAMNIIH